MTCVFRTKLHVALLIATIIVATYGPAEAAVLFSPATLAPSTANLQCLVTNVSEKPVTIQVQLIKTDGSGSSIVKDTTPIVVPAGRSINSSELTTGDVAYCKVTIKGSKTAVRGAILVFDTHIGAIVLQLPTT